MLTNAADTEDVLSATLSKMKLKALTAAAFDAAGRWAVELPAVDILRLHVVLAGECWLTIDGAAPLQLRAGDCFLLPQAKSFVIASDPSVKKKTLAEHLHGTAEDGIVRVVCNGGGQYLGVACAFLLEGHFPKIVFGGLPSVIHIPAHAEQAAILRWTVERFSAEVRNRHAGRALMLRHLAPIILLQTLRSYLASARGEKNWFVALSDPRLSKALAAMQSDYAHDWSLDTLARTAGLSRAGFALNFKRSIGVAPMEYLTQWRMQIACELLASGDRGVGEIAKAVGYESESAFSVAFHKVVACRPGQYRRRLSMGPVPSPTSVRSVREGMG